MRSNERAAVIRGTFGRQDGQVLPLVAAFMVVIAALMVLVIDVGRVYVAQQQIQNAVNAAAAAAGQQMPNDYLAYTDAVAYSGLRGERNALFGYDVTNPTTGLTVTFECLSHGPSYTAGTASTNATCPSDTSTQDTSTLCHPAGSATPPAGVAGAQTSCNAVTVTETATVNSIFGGLIFPGWKVSATAIAAAPGEKAVPVHAYVILDNTISMQDACINSADPSVSLVPGIPVTDTTGRNPTQESPTKLDCAKYGVQALLQTLEPCNDGTLPATTSCGSATVNTGSQGANVATPEGEVGLLVVPAMTTSASGTSSNPGAPTQPTPTQAAGTPLPDELDCSDTQSFNTTYPNYTAPTASTPVPVADEYSGYEAVGLSSDYRTSDASTNLNSASDVVQAVDWAGSGCPATWPTSAANDNNDYYGLKDIGGEGSYLAGAITEAQYLLQQNNTPGVKNAIIIESDGDLGEPDNNETHFVGPSDGNACEDAVNAATQAKSVASTNTLIFAIEYDSTSDSSCNNPSPTTTMEDIATSNGQTGNGAPYYYDDPDPGDLTLPFEEVADSLGQTKLIPNCTSAPPNC